MVGNKTSSIPAKISKSVNEALEKGAKCRRSGVCSVNFEHILHHVPHTLGIYVC